MNLVHNPFDKPGFYPNVPFEFYKTLPYINSSGLKDILSCPALYRWNKDNPRAETRALELGTLIHLAILEPDRWDNSIIVEPQFGDLRKKENKDKKAEFLSTVNSHHVVVDQETIDQIHIMKTNILNHKLFKHLFSNPQRVEETAVWQDPETGLMCKCRFDMIFNEEIIIDLKSTQSARYNMFQKSAFNFGYDLQAAFYSHGFKVLTGKSPKAYMWAVIEKVPSYSCAAYEADEAVLDIGEKKFKKAIKIYEECEKKNEWPGYSDDLIPMAPPGYAFYDLDLD